MTGPPGGGLGTLDAANEAAPSAPGLPGSIACIQAEHAHMLRALDCLEMALELVGPGGPSTVASLAEIQAFLSAFVVHPHHAKEEHLLAVVRLRACPALDGSLDELEREHALLETLISGLRARIRAAVEGRRLLHGSLFSADLRAFIAQERDHIERENRNILPLACSLVDEAEDRRLLALFENLDRKHAERPPAGA